MGRQSLKPAPDIVLKGAGVTPHLQRLTHRVRETFAHLRACPGETTTHSRDASIPVEYGLAESARSHDGAVTSVTSVEMPMPITAPTITTTAITALMKHPQATTTTITKKKLASESPTHSRARGLLTRAHREREEYQHHQNHSTKPERDSLTPSQARGATDEGPD
jgi:hypothetical protein